LLSQEAETAITIMGRHRLFLQLLIASSLCLLSSAASADTPQLQFLTHEFPPFNFSQNGEVAGLAADVVRELQRRNDMHATFTVVPFVRGYMTARTTPNVVLFFVTRDPDREKLFQWVGPIGNVSASFFAPNGSAIKIDSLTDAKRVPAIIVQNGSHPEQVLHKLGFTNIRDVNSSRDAIRMLLLPENKNALALLTGVVVPDTLTQLGLPADGVQPIYTLDKLQAYIAVSNGTSPSVARDFQKALDDMKRDGTFAAIHAKWLPHEKPPGMKPEPTIDTAVKAE
jgi:polar amino acid transport system substrate-binding protein